MSNRKKKLQKTVGKIRKLGTIDRRLQNRCKKNESN
jgi:hypothetical protein